MQRYATTGDEDLMVTRDYLDYLITTCNFKITQISACLFYRKCTVLPLIYQRLVHWRTQAITVPQIQFVKNVINYSCGYFGLNEHKTPAPKCRLVTQLPRTFDFSRTQVSVVGYIGDDTFVVTKTYKKSPAFTPKRKKNSTPLPIFVCVVEFGKLRLAQILTFIEQTTKPCTVRHLYTNVDNFIFALSELCLADCANSTVASLSSLSSSQLSHIDDDNDIDDDDDSGDDDDDDSNNNVKLWKKVAKQFFHTKKPGHLKKEWQANKEQEWKFVSGRVQNWALLTNDAENERHKNSALSHVSTLDSYQMSCNLLNNVTSSFMQKRRVDKMANTKMCEKQFVFVGASAASAATASGAFVKDCSMSPPGNRLLPLNCSPFF